MSKTKGFSKVLALVIMLALVIGILPMGAAAATYGDVTLSIPSGEGLSLSAPSISNQNTTFTYSVVSAVSGYRPANFSLQIAPDANVTVSITTQNGAVITQEGTIPGSNYWLVIPSTSSASSVTVTSSGGYTYIVNCEKPNGADQASLTGLYAYLPAPGQFTNEGVNTGGWGDAFASQSNGLKDLVGTVSNTGVSLGFFGGYVVLDLGTTVDNQNVTHYTPVENSANNPYGIDFIIYGNAFVSNAEPGCVQVAQGEAQYDADNNLIGYIPYDVNEDGVVWYDIAGSLHYQDTTSWDAAYTYQNPVPGNDSTTTYPNTGTIHSDGVEYSFVVDNELPAQNIISYNPFHRHSWFPLWSNYFMNRTYTDNNNNTTTYGPVNQASVLNDNGVVVEERLPFAKYHKDTTNGSTLTLTGVRLGGTASTATGNFAFGYADVHGKNTTSGFTAFDVAYNPYSVTAANIASDSAWNTFLGNSYGGGDPIDISWAVYPARYDTGANAGLAHPNAGEPVDLSSIYYVRVYTGEASMNPTAAFGEISTEVCGVYLASGTGSGTAVAPTITIDEESLASIASEGATVTTTPVSGNQQIITISGLANAWNTEFELEVSGGTYIYMNGANTDTMDIDLTDGPVTVQIINQSGTAEAFITLLKLYA